MIEFLDTPSLPKDKKIVNMSEMTNVVIFDEFWYEKDIHLAPSRVPLEKLCVNLKHFQNRKKPYSEFSVQSIVNAVLSWEFDSRILDRDILWRDGEQDKTFILAGHSRYEAFVRLAAICSDPVKRFELEAVYAHRPQLLQFFRNYDWFQKIPALIIDDVHFDRAKLIALMSNALATVEMDSERAEIYRSFRMLNRSSKEIEEFWKRCEKNNRPRIRAYSHLNPDGKILDLVDAFERNQDDSAIVKRIASWIGNARIKETDLSDLHESELFDWLFHKAWYWTKKWQVNAYPKFLEIVSNHVARMKDTDTFSPTKPLNILNLQSLSHTMRQYYKSLDEITEKRRKLYTEFHGTRRKINANIVDAWTDADINSLMEDLKKKIDVPIDYLRKIEKAEHLLFVLKDSVDEAHALKVLQEIMDHINRLDQEYYALKNKKSAALEASKQERTLEFPE